MDFFTSKQSVVFNSVYGTWQESHFTRQQYLAKYVTSSDSLVNFNLVGNTTNNLTYDNNNAALETTSIQLNTESQGYTSADSASTTTVDQYKSNVFTIQQKIGDTTSYYKQTYQAQDNALSTTYTTSSVFTATQLGYDSKTTSSTSSAGLSSLTSNATGSWVYYVTSTSSYSTSVISTTTGSTTSYSVSSSTWSTVNTDLTIGTSLTTTFNTNSKLTYPYTTSTQGSDSTFTKTNHLISPYDDTVILANAGKTISNYNIGNQIWTFSKYYINLTSSSSGRFSDFFVSYDSNYIEVKNQSKFSTKSIAGTAITYSRNTRATTYSGGSITRTFESYNGIEYTATNNSKTETITKNIGDVSTSITSYGTNTGIQFYSTIQISGYDSLNSFTIGTTTEGAYTSSSTIVVNKFWNSAQSTESGYSRKTTTDEILYSSYLTSGTDSSFVGFKKTTTTNAYLVETTFTYPFWDIQLNPIISRYTSSYSNSYSFTNGVSTEGNSIGETINLKLWTITNISPRIWTNSPIYQENVAVYKSPPIGYAGFGGNFNQSNLSVYQSISIELIGGGTYGTEQTLNSYDLPTALAYDNVTIFPDSIYSSNHPYGAYLMRYISTNDSIGGRLIGITWSTTSQTNYTLKDITGGTTATTTQTIVVKPATYSVSPVGLITGDFYSSGEITFNTSDVRMNNNFSGGYALGNNAIGNDYTVSLGSGYVEWTAYNSTGSVSSAQSSESNGSISFTVPSSLAIVFNAEPILSISWTEGNDYLDHISQSYQYFPT